MENLKLDKENKTIKIYDKNTGLLKATYFIRHSTMVYENDNDYHYKELDLQESIALNNIISEFYKEEVNIK